MPGAFAPGGTGCVSPSHVYVLGFRAGELAELLDSSGVSVDSAPQRARAALGGRLPEEDRDRAPLPRTRARRAVRGCAGELRRRRAPGAADRGRLADDAARAARVPGSYGDRPVLPRLPGWGGQGLRLVATRANGRPAFGSHLGEHGSAVAHAYGLAVLTLRDDRISAVTCFGESGLRACFELPRTLGEQSPSVQESTDVPLTCTDLCLCGSASASTRRAARLVRCAPRVSARAPRSDTGRLMLAHELVAEG